MAVLMRLPQALAVDAGGVRELTVELPPDATLGDLLGEIRRGHPALGRRLCDDTGEVRRFVNVYVGDDESRALDGLRTPVRPGVVVLVAGSVAGG